MPNNGNGNDRLSAISGEVRLFSCRGNRPLAEKIAKIMKIDLSGAETISFSDGEILTQIDSTIRSADIYIIQTTGGSFTIDPKTGKTVIHSVNDMIMELLIMVDAMKRASAGTINAVIPYFGYARQDRKTRAREPISAKLVADMIMKAGVNRVITMDLHSPQIQGFFDIPVDHLFGIKIFSEYFREKFQNEWSDFAVVAPDVGSVAKSRKMAKVLGVPLVIIDKQRTDFDVTKVTTVIGDVKGKKVIIPDDLISTAGTLTNGAQALAELGAKEIYACCTHALLNGPAMQRINDSPIKELVVLDTINIPEEKRLNGKMTVLSSAPIFADAIERIHSGESVSEMFEK
jgi:ribose-phosphate pyrophosphokinase